MVSESPAREKSLKVYFPEAENSIRCHDNKRFVDKIHFSQKFGIPSPQTPETSMPRSLSAPGQHRPVMVGQGKSRSHMDIPPPGMESDQMANNIWGGMRNAWIESYLPRSKLIPAL
jgi:hypothetical protein